MQYSKLHNMCVYDTHHAMRIGNHVPTAKLVSEGRVAVPCTVENMQAMRRLGFEAVSPILHEYDFPIRPPYKPYEHQLHMAAFMTLHPRCFNLSDMGTGKTLSILWALDYLMTKGLIKKAIVIAPLSTIRRVWEDEIFTNFLSRRRCLVVYGDRTQRLNILGQDADIYIINHDGLGVGTSRTNRHLSFGELAKTVSGRADINSVIVDEGSVYKDANTLRYKVLRSVTQSKEYVWWATGTPVPVCPTNAWSQARAVRLDYEETFKSFQERVTYQMTTFRRAAKIGSNELAASILQPAIRYHRDDCLNLPEVTIETRDVELSPTQRKAVDDLKKNLQVMVAGKTINAINEAALRLKLIQIACGAVYDSEHEINKIDCKPRLAVLDEIIEQAGRKILIFAPLTSVVNLIYLHLKDSYSVAKINGTVSSAQRDEIFRAFQQAENPRIIVADPRTMSHGLTLTKAATTIWYGPTDQPEVYQQANKRMDRPGQTSKMLIVRLAATSIEREIFKRLDNKETMQGIILDLIKGD
jgi:SNF2 family DNA or RNA helicase